MKPKSTPEHEHEDKTTAAEDEIAHREALIDEALEETFPASDPTAPAHVD